MFNVIKAFIFCRGEDMLLSKQLCLERMNDKHEFQDFVN